VNALVVIEPEVVAVSESAIGLNLPDDTTFEAWCHLGHSLASNQRRSHWLIADWAKFGRDHFQHKFPFMAEQLSIDVRKLGEMAKTAANYPEGIRADNVSFEVHQKLGSIEPEARLPMLKQASLERWTTKVASHHIIEHKKAQGALWDEDSEEQAERLATELWRMWNRLPTPRWRSYAYDLIQASAESGFGVINEGEAA